MRILSFIFGTLVSIGHIWTTIIAFKQSGIIGAILSLVLPVLSEIYWVIKMIGVNNNYIVYMVLCVLVFLPLASVFGKSHYRP